MAKKRGRSEKESERSKISVYATYVYSAVSLHCTSATASAQSDAESNNAIFLQIRLQKIILSLRNFEAPDDRSGPKLRACHFRGQIIDLPEHRTWTPH